MSPAAWVALLNAGSVLVEAIDKAMDEEPLPIGDPDVDRAMKVFSDRQVHLGERFEEAMLAMLTMDETKS